MQWVSPPDRDPLWANQCALPQTTSAAAEFERLEYPKRATMNECGSYRPGIHRTTSRDAVHSTGCT
jgi:hypothetical protein